jgi:hypothetical protein
VVESDRAVKKARKRADKAQKKAAKKQYERNHAQLKRQQAFSTGALAAQVRRGKKQAKTE